MSISTYSELQDAVKAWMLRASTDLVVTTAQVKNYISLCESELNRELRVRELEDSASLSTVAAQNYVSVPATFKRVQDLSFDSSPFDMNYVADRATLRSEWGITSGRPVNYTIFGEKIYLAPIPDAVYAITIDFYKEIPALSDSATTNDILTAYPDVYLYGALRHGFMQIKDKDSQAIVEQSYVSAIQRIKDSDAAGRMPSNLRMKTRERLA